MQTNTQKTMSEQQYTIKTLMKLSKEELQKMCEKLGIKFQENDTKKMLSNAILGFYAQQEETEEETEEENFSYTLAPKSRRVILPGGKVLERDEALADQKALALLYNSGHRAVKRISN